MVYKDYKFIRNIIMRLLIYEFNVRELIILKWVIKNIIYFQISYLDFIERTIKRVQPVSKYWRQLALI